MLYLFFITPSFVADEPKTVFLLSVIHSNCTTLTNLFWSFVQTGSKLPSQAVQAYWTSMVVEGGDWDYKLKYGWNTDLKTNVNGEYIYIKGEDYGNIHYGYTGRSIGFSGSTLLTAGGIVQIATGNSQWSYWDTYWDDPNDASSVQRGIDWYSYGY